MAANSTPALRWLRFFSPDGTLIEDKKNGKNGEQRTAKGEGQWLKPAVT